MIFSLIFFCFYFFPLFIEIHGSQKYQECLQRIGKQAIDISSVKECIQSFSQSERLSLLEKAVEVNSNEIAKFIFQMESRDVPEYSLSVFKGAVESRNWSFASFISENGDVRGKNQEGKTALHLLFNQKGNRDEDFKERIVEKLIARGVDINARDLEEKTPLHWAVINAQYYVKTGRSIRSVFPSAVQKLLESGADPCLEDRQGNTVFHYAFENKEFDNNHILLMNKKLEAETILKFFPKYAKLFFHNLYQINKWGNERLKDAKNRGISDANRERLGNLGKKDLYFSAEYLNIILENFTHIGESRQELLYQACQDGWLEAVKLLAERGANIYKRTKEGFTPLHIAAKGGHKEVIEYLLSLTIDPDIQDKKLNTPLHLFLKNLSDLSLKVMPVEGILDIFIKNKADFKKKNSMGETPLHCLIKRSIGECFIGKFLNEGASIMDEDNDGCTPFHLAAQYFDKDDFQSFVSGFLKYKLKSNAEYERLALDLFVLDSRGRSVLHFAAQNRINSSGHPRFFAGLVTTAMKKNKDISLCDNQGRTVLHYAVLNENTNVVNFLLRDGEFLSVIDINSLNIRDSNQKTPFDYAYESGNLDMIEVFFKTFAEKKESLAVIQIFKKYGDKLLRRAYKTGSSNIVLLFVESGMNLDTLDEKGKTLLHYICEMRSERFLKVFAEGIASLNPFDSYGRTPLYCLCDTTDIACVCRDKNQECDKCGEKAEVELVTCAKLLIEKGADVNKISKKFDYTPLYAACGNGRTKMAKLLVNKGADVNLENHISQTPLDLAVRSGNIKLVQFLVERGAFINKNIKCLKKGEGEKNFYINTGTSPLHIAALWGHKDIVKFLIERGAFVNAETTIKKTPLHFVVQNGYENRLEIATLLIKAGASIDIKDFAGKTPLDVAVEIKDELLSEFFSTIERQAHAKDIVVCPKDFLVVRKNNIALCTGNIHSSAEVQTPGWARKFMRGLQKKLKMPYEAIFDANNKKIIVIANPFFSENNKVGGSTIEEIKAIEGSEKSQIIPEITTNTLDKTSEKIHETEKLDNKAGKVAVEKPVEVCENTNDKTAGLAQEEVKKEDFEEKKVVSEMPINTLGETSEESFEHKKLDNEVNKVDVKTSHPNENLDDVFNFTTPQKNFSLLLKTIRWGSGLIALVSGGKALHLFLGREENKKDPQDLRKKKILALSILFASLGAMGSSFFPCFDSA